MSDKWVNGTVVSGDKNKLDYRVDDNLGKIIDVKFNDIQYYLWEGDNIICKYDSMGLSMVEKPLVIISDKLPDIIKTLKVIVGYKKKINIDLVLNNIVNDGMGNVIDFLDSCSDRYDNECDKYKTIDPSVLMRYFDKIAKRVVNKWREYRLYRQLHLFGITKAEINNTDQSLREMIEFCMTNPYKIITLSIEKADSIFIQRFGEVNDDLRKIGLYARVLYNNCENSGNHYINYKYATKLIPDFEAVKDKLLSDYNILIEDELVYIRKYYIAERVLANYFKIHNKKFNDIDPTYTCETLTDMQKLAVKRALNNNVTIITGAAGSGKTTVIKEIYKNIKNPDKCRFVSFTGKAVSRIKKVAGIDEEYACTLHYLMCRSDIKYLDYLIIDEMSMVTDLLLSYVLRFIYVEHLICIGDPNQLPPIGPGDLFNNLISCDDIEHIHLDKVHRHGADNDMILNNAVSMLTNEDHKFNWCNNFNRVREAGKTDMQLINAILMLLKRNDMKDFVILSPYNKCIDVINAEASKIFNGGSQEITKKNTTYRVGDRVMMIRNDNTRKIMNGDEGVVTEVNEKYIDVEFETVVRYFYDLKDDDSEDEFMTLLVDMLKHSYAQTIHKSQGSEYDVVLLYIDSSITETTKFLNKPLIYTAITRAKKSFFYIGNQQLLDMSSKNIPGKRLDLLAKTILQ